MLSFFKIITLVWIIQVSDAQNVPGVCICVPTGTCNNNNTNPGNGGGTGSINGNPATGNSGTSIQLTTPASSGINPTVNSVQFCNTGLERCCPSAGFTCGVRYPPVAGSRQPQAGQAQFGEYPWQAVILAPGDIYQGSGVLIDNFHVLTAAHRVSTFVTNGQTLKIRMGEWDASSNTEPIPYQDFQISRIFIHPQFETTSLRNDVALLRLATPVQLGQVPTITTACLPSTVVNGNIRCWLAGWGRSDFSNTAAYSAIEKEVDLPLVDQNTCQNQLRATRLGASYSLDFTSFVCAGGEPGKDACTGDGGSPLMCQIAGNFYVVGLVAWGIGCGTSNVPGVYVNTASYIQWIQQTTRS